MVMMEQAWKKNTNQEMFAVVQMRATGREMDGFGIFLVCYSQEDLLVDCMLAVSK